MFNFFFFSELGTRQHCRDNVTMFSDQTFVYYQLHYVYIRCGYSMATEFNTEVFTLKKNFVFSFYEIL